MKFIDQDSGIILSLKGIMNLTSQTPNTMIHILSFDNNQNGKGKGQSENWPQVKFLFFYCDFLSAP